MKKILTMLLVLAHIGMTSGCATYHSIYTPESGLSTWVKQSRPYKVKVDDGRVYNEVGTHLGVAPGYIDIYNKETGKIDRVQMANIKDIEEKYPQRSKTTVIVVSSILGAGVLGFTGYNIQKYAR